MGPNSTNIATILNKVAATGIIEKLAEINKLKGVSVIPNPVERSDHPDYQIYYSEHLIMTVKSDYCGMPLNDSKNPTIECWLENVPIFKVHSATCVYRKIEMILTGTKDTSQC